MFMILVGNIFLMLLLGSASFEKLYTYNKNRELKASAQSIKVLYEKDNDEYMSQLSAVEKKNTTIHIFRKDAQGDIVLEYYSRMGFSPKPEFSRFQVDKFVRESIKNFYKSDMKSRIESEGFVFSEPNSTDFGPARNSIGLYTKLNDDTYLFLETPRQYIRESAELSIIGCAGISIITLVIAAAVLYIACKRLTEPIAYLQKTAEKIKSLDFSARCPVNSTDEFGMLAEDINSMANSLEMNAKELERSNKMLRDDLHKSEQQDMMRKRFIANVSHDFKTPLTLIISYADGIKQLKNDEISIRNEYCNIISSEGLKLSKQVQTLLNLSQLESKMITLKMMDFSINQLIKEIVYSQKVLMQNNHLSLELDFPNEIIVSADYQKIQQVLTNLLDNAIKYVDDNKIVKINTQIEGENCKITIFNSCAAIENDVLENLFISFYRADQSRGETQGYGLGLAIVKGIMELHGEQYGIKNVAGGVEVWFNLKISQLNDQC